MKVVERFVKGKLDKEELCEDGIFISSDYLAVVDGASSRTKKEYEGKTPGRFVMEVITKSLEDLPKEYDVKSAVKFLVKKLSDEYKRLGVYDYLKKFPNDRPSASVVIYSKKRKELWFVGDCQVLIDGLYFHNEKKIDTVMIEARALYLQQEVESGADVNKLRNSNAGWDFIWPVLSRQSIFQNSGKKSEFSYATIDGFKVDTDEIVVMNVAKASQIVMASDGYPELKPTLKETEKFLAKVNKEDPLCIYINKSFKSIQDGMVSFDDRAYLSFVV